MTERSTVVDYLDVLRAVGKACAYVQHRGYRTERWSYSQVAETAFHFARELSLREIGEGDRVMLWGASCAEWVAVFWGCVAAGAVVVPMDNTASGDFAGRVFGQVGAKLLVRSRQNEALSEYCSPPSIILEDLSQTVSRHSYVATSDFAARPEDVLQIVFTSGTTAEPKGVVITHGNVIANIAPIEKEMKGYLKYERFVHPLRFLNLLPLSHVFGQFLGIFLPPLLGATVIFQDELKPSEIANTIRRERVSVLVSVPRVLQSLKQKVERDLEDEGKLNYFRSRFRSGENKHFLRRWWIFRRIRRRFGWKFWAFISGGATLDAETEAFWGRLGYAVIQGYGLTETTSLISVNHPFRLGKGSVGKVLPGREMRLAEDGEIMVRGASVASGYWDGHPHQTAGDEQGWYRTGDVGAVDDAGNLYFKGRKKDVIVTPGGTNVYPEDIEAALRRQPEVKECVVVGIERGGNAEPCAVIIPHRDANAKAAIERANASLASYQRVRLWLQWPQEEFPRTSMQKPRRNLIRDFAEARISGSEPPAQGSEKLENPLAELLAQITGRRGDKPSTGSNLESDFGLSSLDRVELLGALEDRYQVDLDETSFAAAHTLGDLERMLRGESKERVVYHYPRWTLRWPVTWLRFLAHYVLLRPAIILLGWPRIEGRENLDGYDGPLLVVSNHVAGVDVGFIQTALPARFRHRLATATGGEALEALRNPPPERNLVARTYDRMEWALGVSLLNLFPLPRETGFRQSFAYAGEAVDRGYSVLIFPEGRHTIDGNLNPFRAGIGLLAMNLGIPVLPVRIHGLFEVKQAGKRFAGPWTISVRIGKPVRFDHNSDAQEIAKLLRGAVEEL